MQKKNCLNKFLWTTRHVFFLMIIFCTHDLQLELKCLKASEYYLNEKMAKKKECSFLSNIKFF